MYFSHVVIHLTLFIDREAREIMYLVASVRLSVCPSVRPFVSLSDLSCRKKSHYQSEVFVCVSTISRGCGRSAFNFKKSCMSQKS